jgi:hypothetical protein
MLCTLASGAHLYSRGFSRAPIASGTNAPDAPGGGAAAQPKDGQLAVCHPGAHAHHGPTAPAGAPSMPGGGACAICAIPYPAGAVGIGTDPCGITGGVLPAAPVAFPVGPAGQYEEAS